MFSEARALLVCILYYYMLCPPPFASLPPRESSGHETGNDDWCVFNLRFNVIINW